MPVTTQSMSQHLAPGFREILGTRLGGRESYYSQFCRVETSERNYEDFLVATGLPMATEKPEGEAIQAFDPLEGKTRRFTHKVYAIGLEISEEAHEDDLYKGKGSAITEAAEGLADSIAEVVEVEAHRLVGSEAFLTASVPTFLRALPSDSATISTFNTAHQSVGGAELSSQSNRPSTEVDLSVTSIRAGISAFRKWKTDRNLRIPGFDKPMRLICGVDLEWDAKEILRSTNRPDTANRVENVTPNMAIISTPYITDEDQWILQGQKHMMTFMWRQRPKFDAFDDRRRRVAVMISWVRFSIGTPHYLGVYGSTGAA